MTTRNYATQYERSLQPADFWSDQCGDDEVSTSITSALLVFCGEEGWTPESYERCCHVTERTSPYAALIWEREARRRRRFQ